MKRSLLTRLHSNGIAYIIGALLLLLGLPLYQTLILSPAGYGDALNALTINHFASYLAWIHTHLATFILYRLFLIISFALLISFPFSLFRIIVAQEIMAQQEREHEELAAEDESKDKEDTTINPGKEVEEDRDEAEEDRDEAEDDNDGMPPYAWRGKGFAIIAAWAGLFGLLVYVIGAIVSTLYFVIVGSNATSNIAPTNIALLSNLFALATNTAGLGLLALATLFFGAMIARSGRNLWPTSWVAFSYLALAVAALLSGGAVGVAGAPNGGQSAFTTPSILLFALWILWLGIMLVRLKPEP